ncbi:hypothetical protein T440DRAFT_552662 [Plenodomus tracheiphilus IPT5]|uniref:ATPase AAA-type core domain-containing protein n=1 Tax=Plenodomus tracheiphilus IPT5 TaxID=1408161 RepID=A0A6A7BD05_9PLEO|nr:hypothetical protein T440DRAFT_552662 [Plenodomus tracheiphilus IPT5]
MQRFVDGKALRSCLLLVFVFVPVTRATGLDSPIEHPVIGTIGGEKVFPFVAKKKKLDQLSIKQFDAILSPLQSCEGFKDVVAGKGQGLTVLLHGSPGSGKPLTAEVISEHSQKPLLRITNDDLRTEPGTAEKKLQEYFDLAHDMLGKRSCFSMKQMSSLTGAPLKETFDEAFQSRIHLQIPYMPADYTHRNSIWTNIVAAQKTEPNLDAAAFERLAARCTRNGRNIKNMVLLALMISKARGDPMNEATIDEVGRLD